MYFLREKTREIGAAYEAIALKHLKEHNLKLIAKNYLTKLGEIDLIMHKGNLLCFIEVRFRKSNEYGGAEASVTPSKQAKIKKTAEFFLMQNPKYQSFTCRFDVIAISPAQDKPTLNWITSAFI